MYHWKECGKAVQVQKSSSVSSAEKSSDLNFHTRDYKQPQHYRLKRARITSRACPATAYVSHLFLTINTKLFYFSYPSTSGVVEVFQDLLRILRVLPIDRESL